MKGERHVFSQMAGGGEDGGLGGDGGDGGDGKGKHGQKRRLLE